ncbi:hypothetical protein SERLA73DRAFT_182510 [Serpula lacrymans var. lacrymans S7.3]|uniref:A-kinase anchor protein 7-like phosphoesterase domain-containing protein n=2 Tax=Serpula lacrymans var. lacrymans TaxID=341189 RepID=F8Q0A0_SERL3|nr:uncharacterized protein SERLADRAFT_469195 [Serpula lacrymans var. lacrymans S7.9]EGN97767.1 hypothetical protein SERLA73DRAFT_182510 [Serpula lacrymans var. lacrymans S7.3]EGO23360.1 hypothetical protein SERLADRAFT_469195 [Serpula lacrymans var. lacrymans S7.9]
MAFNHGSTTARAGRASYRGNHFHTTTGRGRNRSDIDGNNITQGTGRPAEHRPTHFIALPIGHHRLLREKISTFTNAVTLSSPPISGLDKSIVVAPRRLHLTLGVMCLNPALSGATSTSQSFKTLPAALNLLSALKPRIMEMIGDKRLCVPLNFMDIMNPDRGDHDKAHVLWMGPSLDSEDAQLLKRVCEMVTKAFTDAGFVTDRRPLKLHCTVINTIYRKPKSRGPRQPFSYKSLLMSTSSRPYLCNASPSPDFRRPVPIEFGKWNVDEVQICEMGSYGPQGEYVSCGGCSLVA